MIHRPASRLSISRYSVQRHDGPMKTRESGISPSATTEPLKRAFCGHEQSMQAILSFWGDTQMAEILLRTRFAEDGFGRLQLPGKPGFDSTWQHGVQTPRKSATESAVQGNCCAVTDPLSLRLPPSLPSPPASAGLCAHAMPGTRDWRHQGVRLCVRWSMGGALFSPQIVLLLRLTQLMGMIYTWAHRITKPHVPCWTSGSPRMPSGPKILQRGGGTPWRQPADGQGSTRHRRNATPEMVGFDRREITGRTEAADLTRPRPRPRPRPRRIPRRIPRRGPRPRPKTKGQGFRVRSIQAYESQMVVLGWVEQTLSRG